MASDITDYDIVGWRAWYTGNRRYDSSDTAWCDLPSEGALVFVLYQRAAGRRRIMQGVSLYWKDGDIYACDNVADALIPDGLDRAMIKRGKWTTDGEFEKARQEAFQMMEMP